LAEREGFEPTVVFSYSRFPGVRLKPLSHLSGHPPVIWTTILLRATFFHRSSPFSFHRNRPRPRPSSFVLDPIIRFLIKTEDEEEDEDEDDKDDKDEGNAAAPRTHEGLIHRDSA
jgi:hypothetical protein